MKTQRPTGEISINDEIANVGEGFEIMLSNGAHLQTVNAITENDEVVFHFRSDKYTMSMDTFVELIKINAGRIYFYLDGETCLHPQAQTQAQS